MVRYLAASPALALCFVLGCSGGGGSSGSGLLPAAGQAGTESSMLSFGGMGGGIGVGVGSHVKDLLYYQFNGLNANLTPTWIAGHADAVLASTLEITPSQVSALTSRGVAVYLYEDPTYVPYCVAPFTETAGTCKGQQGNQSASAWIHDSTGARINRSIGGGNYQEMINPQAAGARAQLASFEQSMISQFGATGFFSDDSAGVYDNGSGDPGTGVYYGFNRSGVEIASATAWKNAEYALLHVANYPLIVNGADVANDMPSYGGYFLTPPVFAENREGCFVGDGPLVGNHWYDMAQALLATTAMHVQAVCMHTGAVDPQSRLYTYASWLITYDPNYSRISSTVGDNTGHSGWAEWGIVPSASAPGPLSSYALGSLYARTFTTCYQGSKCTAIVNSTSGTLPIPNQSLHHALVLDKYAWSQGGTITVTAAPSALAAHSGAILIP